MNNTFVRTLIGVVVGLLLGAVYGWLVRPIEYVDTTPDSLRADYRTDYILMVAEAYTAEENLELAQIRLAALGPRPPAEILASALEYAQAQGFSPRDLELLARLMEDIEDLPSEPEIGGP